MIRRLRDRHRQVIPLLALIAAIALVIAIRAHHRPVAAAVPGALPTHLEAR